MISFRFSFVLLLSCLVILRAEETYGTLYGKVRDGRTGEDLIGASILLVGTKLGGATDIEGRFTIKRIPIGTYDIQVSFLGYETKLIAHTEIKSSEPIQLDIVLQSNQGIQQQEVIISATTIRSGEGAILAERRKAETIGDGISAEQVKRSPDATSSDILKRVVGLSIVDNKFVFIRGASERYNGATINGANVSSTEVGKKSFAFDMIPANLLENTTVVKSATPDLPGDFTGGLVQMNTLDFPDTRTMKIGITSGWNSITTSKNFQSSQGGNKDWVGVDDGTRALPREIPENLTQMAKELPNTWAPKNTKAPVNMSLSLSFGDKISLADDDNDQFGYVGAFSYRDAFQRNYKTIDAVELSQSYAGTQDVFSVLWGGMLNLSYKFSGLHKLSFKNNYSQTADDQVRSLIGTDRNIGTENTILSTMWSERKTYTGIFSGEHQLPALGNLNVDWKISVSTSQRNDPDRKDVTYSRILDDPNAPFEANINQRSWSHLTGRTNDYYIDFSLPTDGAKIKFGSMFEKKTASYDVRFYNVYFAPGGYSDSIATLPIETIYSSRNFGANKLIMSDASKPTDNYWGNQELFAGYGMVDVPFSLFENNFRIVGGVRLENSLQRVFVPRTYSTEGPTNDALLKTIDILPSANLTYLINESTNLRFAYSHTVNRPEFREMASSGYYDFTAYEIVGGNPNLRRSYIHNYDVRFEVFPEPGEVIAVSYFYKNISGAIEEQLFFSSTRQRTWFNSNNAKNDGYELEVRKSLSFLGGFFNYFSLMGNYTRIYSEVRFPLVSGSSTNTNTTEMGTRPLQGQSPYMVNLSLMFTEPTLRTVVNVLYNKFGKRLDAVGFLTSDIYEQPRDLIDVSISQPFSNGVETRLTIKNLANKERVLTQQDRVYQRTNSGTTYSLQVTVSL